MSAAAEPSVDTDLGVAAGAAPLLAGHTPGPWLDLLAALKAMVNRWEPDTTGADRRMWEDACDAIAKAEAFIDQGLRDCKPDSDLLQSAKNAAATIAAIYQWVERVEKAGGARSVNGIGACHAMLKSLRKNADRTERLVMVPLRAAIAKTDGTP